jgi:antibiotic biosynthesis monooxygenase (ABM) superfamily enzyme
MALAAATDPLTVQISRTVRAGRESEFEEKVRAFVPRSLEFPGHLGVQVVKPAPGAGREYHVIIRFSNRELWDRFLASEAYTRFRAEIEPLLEKPPEIQEMCGLESWFTPPGEALRPLPKWKMALVTLLGVYPTSLLLGAAVGPRVRDLPMWLSGLVMASSIVVALTWLVMPLLTRLLHRWLHPPKGNRP